MDVAVRVPLAFRKGSDTMRVAGLLDDDTTVVVATMTPEAELATPELAFELAQALQIAEACLAGHTCALTTPGLARILSATVAILFRVSLAAGAIAKIQGDHADGHREN